MSDTTCSSKSPVKNSTEMDESDRSLALAVFVKHDAKKRSVLNQKLHMLQKEERALQTLLVRLRGQQSNLTIEKIRLAEEHKRLVGTMGVNFNELDDEDDEDEDEDEDEEEDEGQSNEIVPLEDQVFEEITTTSGTQR